MPAEKLPAANSGAQTIFCLLLSQPTNSMKPLLLLILLLHCIALTSRGQVPANDECTGAPAISTNPFGTSCTSPAASTTVGATASGNVPACAGGSADDDVWYQFTAASAAVIIRVSNAVQVPGGAQAGIGAELLTGSCGALFSRQCSSNLAFGSGFVIANGLTIGNTYFVRFWTNNNTSRASFDFCIQDVAPATANDACSNAVVVGLQPFGVSCNASVTANTNGATPSAPSPSCAGADANDDIWYKFTASTASILLRFSNAVQTINGSTANIGFALYDGACPAGGAEVFCDNNAGFGSGFTIINGLVPGNTYLLRVFGTGSNNYVNFDFCIQEVSAQPANDECSNASPLILQTFGSSCTAAVSANTTGATPSTPAPSCASLDQNDDIWYSFTAVSGSILLRFSNALLTTSNTTGNLGYALYSGSCPAGTATLSCSNNIGFGSGFKIIDGLVPGNTYLLRLFSTAGNNYLRFDFCVTAAPAPPVNDECSNAISIATQPFGTTCAAAFTVNTSGATASAFSPSCAATDANDDVWYSFTPGSSSVMLRFSNAILTTSGATGNLGYALYDGAACPSGTSTLSCSNNIGFGGGLQILSGLIAGHAYYLRLFSNSNNNYIQADVCLQETPPAPSNDDCAGAVSISTGQPGTLCVASVSVNTSGATPSVNNASCFVNGSNNDDVWYSFMATATTAVLRYANCRETTSGNGALLGYALYNTCPSGNTALQCSNGFGFINGFVLLSALTPGNTYLLRLFGSGINNYVSFTFCVQSPLSNDECTSALPVPVSNGFCTNPVIASLNGATASVGFGSPSCRIGGPERDVWFTAIIPSSGNLIVQTSAIKLAGSDLVMTAYSGTCGALSQLACDDDGNPETFPSANHSRIVLLGRSPGELITIRVTAAFSGSEEPFAICAWDESIAVLPAISAGGNCVPGSGVTIDSAHGNSYMWVPVFDGNGHVIAEVYSDGKDPGAIAADVFVNTSGNVRNIAGAFYADRNITLTPVFNTGGRVRLYLKNTELLALQAADPLLTGAAALQVNKTSGVCSPVLSGSAELLPAIPAPYGNDLYLQFSTNNFSSFFLSRTAGALPVRLLSFNAGCSGNAVHIKWTTTAESSNKLFTLEKSNNGAAFEILAEIQPAMAGSAARNEYQFTDRQPASGKTYYRLRQTDWNGRSVYLTTIIADCSTRSAPAAFPNPVGRQLQIAANRSYRTVKLELLTAAGVLLAQTRHDTYIGNILTVPAQQWSPGVYLLRLTVNDGTAEIIKIIKQ
jgi:hypothetical protein